MNLRDARSKIGVVNLSSTGCRRNWPLCRHRSINGSRKPEAAQPHQLDSAPNSDEPIIAGAHRIALRSPPAFRETLHGIARTHGEPDRWSAALTTVQIRRLAGVCDDDLAGPRDRTLLLIGFAGVLRRSE